MKHFANHQGICHFIIWCIMHILLVWTCIRLCSSMSRCQADDVTANIALLKMLIFQVVEHFFRITGRSLVLVPWLYKDVITWMYNCVYWFTVLRFVYNHRVLALLNTALLCRAMPQELYSCRIANWQHKTGLIRRTSHLLICKGIICTLFHFWLGLVERSWQERFEAQKNHHETWKCKLSMHLIMDIVIHVHQRFSIVIYAVR